jgi:hypothetical protein
MGFKQKSLWLRNPKARQRRAFGFYKERPFLKVVLTRFGFIHTQIASIKLSTIKPFNCSICFVTIRHFNKTKAAAAVCFAIHDHFCTSNVTKLCENFAQPFIITIKRKVSNINIHTKLS